MCELVPFERDHGEGVIEAVHSVFDEYGFTWEAEGYCRDLYAPEDYYIRPGGMFWTLLDEGRVIGCVGVLIDGPNSELHRIYLHRDWRGRGLGRRLLEATMDYARQRECVAMRAWSDVKLKDAHGLYLKMGFERRGERICDDPDDSHEYGFWKEPL